MKNDDNVREHIRNVLIECRTQRNLTQTEVGKAVGKSKTAVASWEQGLSLPDIVTLLKLSHYYDVSIDYIYGESDDSHIR